ncbi:hypothetical protein BVRB_4g094060 [Beta vulgaris subsp. vulgaris]|nr:hypothetical protein BVRB_4g094060 [Beta vulgaris subsp. vulgaris]
MLSHPLPSLLSSSQPQTHETLRPIFSSLFVPATNSLSQTPTLSSSKISNPNLPPLYSSLTPCGSLSPNSHSSLSLSLISTPPSQNEERK